MISVAIPTSTMANGEELFVRCLESLWNQSFQDFEIVVTDNSENDTIKEICDYYKTGINYYRNPIKGMAQNTNEAIRRSKGDLVKIIYMDDFLAHDRALSTIVNRFEDGWLVTACTHNTTGQNFTHSIHYARYTPEIARGANTIGSPSVLTIENEQPILFDENMTWLLDADYYYRLHQRYGEPVILSDINVVIGLHNSQMTHLISDERKMAEQEYLQAKNAK